MKRILCFVLALALVFSLSVTAFAEEPETLAEDNTMLNFCVDVTKDSKYYDAVLWAYLSGLTDGTDDVHFSPDHAVSRGQAVTFLWRLAGKPVVDYFMLMDDVPSGKYYTEAIRWALSEGIASGTSKTTFSPDKACTVGEMITLLWRFSGSPVVNYAMDMKDVPSGAFYTEAIRWALSLGIAHGAADNTFGPGKVCTREKTVSSLYRFCTLIFAAAKAASTGEDAVVRIDEDSPAVLVSNVADSITDRSDPDIHRLVVLGALAGHADKTSTPTGDPIGPGNDQLHCFVCLFGVADSALKAGDLQIRTANNTPAGSDHFMPAAKGAALVVSFVGMTAQDEITQLIIEDPKQTIDPEPVIGPEPLYQQEPPLLDPIYWP